jgi:hypothetical protein
MANLSGNNVGINYKGILNLGSTINQNMSSGFQAITDGDNNASSLSISDTSISINSKINIGNSSGDPGIFNDNPDLINISVNTETVVVSNGYSTGSYTSVVRPDAAFEVASTNQGFLLPRMTTTQRNNINLPTPGLMIYDTDQNKISYYNRTAWVYLAVEI